jgi:hypothetical protein
MHANIKRMTRNIERRPHFNQAYRAHLKQMKITRSITGLTGKSGNNDDGNDAIPVMK